MRRTHTLGDTEPWGGGSSSGVVFVWRAAFNVPVQHPDDALRLVRAVGRSHKFDAPLGFDVRGITVHDRGVDVVLTGGSTAFLVFGQDVGSWIADSVRSDEVVRSRWPSFAVDTAEFLEITAPPSAIDFWRSAPALWDSDLGSGHGGPTAAFEAPQGLYVGVADATHALKPLTSSQPVPVPMPVPSSTPSATTSTAIWVIGTVLVVWLASRGLWRKAGAS